MYKLATTMSLILLSSIASACDCGKDKAPAEPTAIAPVAATQAEPAQAAQKAEVATPSAVRDAALGKENAVDNDSISFDILSSHNTEATLKEFKDLPCRFLTSLCPDRCGHATRVAVFQITKYLQYKKEGQYGDPKQELFYLDLKKDPYGQNKSIRQTAEALKIGDKVKLNWNHLYIKKAGSSYPERPVVLLEKITE